MPAGFRSFAVDIPSGLDADTGLPLGTAIQAEATATFGFAKIGQVLYPGARLCGALAVVDIGIAPEAVAECPPRTALLEAGDVARLLPLRDAEAHKGTTGHVLVIAGSFGKTGAAQLVSRAALRAGAGLVTLAGPRSLYPIYAGGVLEAMTDALPDRDGRIRFDEGAPARARRRQGGGGDRPGDRHSRGRRQDRALVAAQLGDPCSSSMPTACTVVARDLERAAQGVGAGDRYAASGRDGAPARQQCRVRCRRTGSARRAASPAEQRCTLVLKGARTVIADGSRQGLGQPDGQSRHGVGWHGRRARGHSGWAARAGRIAHRGGAPRRLGARCGRRPGGGGGR